MRYEIQLSPDAVDDLRSVKANIRVGVLDVIEETLRYEPEKESKSRIKRLNGLSRSQYRLRVDEYRIYYDISGNFVQILALVSKEQSVSWLEREGVKK